MKSLLHADQAEPSFRERGLQIETPATVPHGKVHLVAIAAQIDLHVVGTTMLNSVAQSFLENPENAQ
jgi:hypothetical protein